MIGFSEQRVGVLVDIQNMYYSGRIIHKKKVNFKAVLEEGVGDRKLIRAFAYGVKTPEQTEEKFFEALEKSGYEVKTKDLQVFPDGTKKGDWDVGIAVDAIKMATKLDVIVLVSGDGDYIPLMQYLQNTFGCRVEVMAFQESTNAKVIDVADKYTNLSDNKKRFLIA
jgi:uncharacterized LabA/DUF88 family protein